MGDESDLPTVVFVDNFDSFTYNLVEYVSDGAETVVFKNTASIAEIEAAKPNAIVISPGPGHPKNDRDVGVTREVLRELSPTVPTLGVCLGLEAAVYEFGGQIGRAPTPVHGKASAIDHDGRGVFEGLDQGFRAGRYHSLVATSVPDCLEISATTASNRTPAEVTDEPVDEPIVMGVRHRTYPIECVQFHPESVLTGVGHDLIANFLEFAEDAAESEAARNVPPDVTLDQ